MIAGVDAPTRTLAPAVREALAWGAAVLYPAALFLAVVNWPPGRSGLQLLLLPAVLAGLPVPLLLRRPLPALVLVLAGSAAVVVSPPGQDSAELATLQAVFACLAIGFLAAVRPVRTVIAATVGTLAALSWAATYHTAGSDHFVTTVVMIGLGLVAAAMIGNSVRQRRAHARAVRAQATTQAITDERLRIARELHDSVAHTIGVIAIQAGTGRRVIDTQPGQARDALAAIEATSRETLAGLRRMLGTLRQSAPDPAPIGAVPGLAGLDRLVARTARTGIRVEVCRRGEPQPLPPEVDISAFRIVQEAVTNVVRHAGAPECRVVIEFRDDELSIEVTDDGHTAASPGTGYGITGMRERVGLLGGRLDAGPRPEGGFRVAARLPLPAPAR